MGDVFEATDLTTGRRCALKVLRTEFARPAARPAAPPAKPVPAAAAAPAPAPSASGTQMAAQPGAGGEGEPFSDAHERFLREVSIGRELHHPGIVEVFDAGVLSDGRPYLAMELLQGEDLARRLRRLGPMAVAHAVEVLSTAAQALEAAHQRGVIHRDIKPSNIFLCEPDQKGQQAVKLIDFGVAKFSGADAELTATREVLGTVLYLAPEQLLLGAKRVDSRADVFALGATLYQVLVGEPPFGGPSHADILEAIAYGPTPSARARRAEVPGEVDAVIARALDKHPRRRYPTAAAFAEALQAGLLASQQAARSPTDPSHRVGAPSADSGKSEVPLRLRLVSPAGKPVWGGALLLHAGQMLSLGRRPDENHIICRIDPETPENLKRTRTVSQRHARVVMHGGSWAVEDMGSLAGTFVDGERLTGRPRPLHDGSRLSLGQFVRFEVHVLSGALMFQRVDSGGDPEEQHALLFGDALLVEQALRLTLIEPAAAAAAARFALGPEDSGGLAGGRPPEPGLLLRRDPTSGRVHTTDALQNDVELVAGQRLALGSSLVAVDHPPAVAAAPAAPAAPGMPPGRPPRP
jgi:serine/threonine protein kinase